MRIWDLPAGKLCRQHLLGEHRELHAIWSILVHGKKGYAHHPETLRWKGKLKALFLRHEHLVREMTRRGYSHRTPLEEKRATGAGSQRKMVNTRREQAAILRGKGCDCNV